MKADSVHLQPTNRLWAREWTNNEVGDMLPGEGGNPKEQFVRSQAEAPSAPSRAHFSQVRQTLEQAKPGDMILAQMYEFENASTNGDKDAAKTAPGYADQQAILPDLAAAAKRGVNVQVVLDASKSKETKDLQNRPVADYLTKAGQETGHLTLDFYPPNTVNIDHAKELVHLSKGPGGTYQVEKAIAGGSNWGNHTPANDDGGGVFYGKDAVGAADIFFRDQAFCRGDTSSPAEPHNDPKAPVQWHVTAPTAEGGGSTGIRDAKLDLTKEADSVYMNEFCLTHPDLLKAVEAKGAEAHVRVDPNEYNVNKGALDEIRQAGGQAMWANTQMDPNMPGQKNHEKLDVYVKGNQAFAATIGSANDTANGLETTHSSPSPTTGAMTSHRTNHEIDAVVNRVTQGDYSTAPFLDAALAKTKNDLEQRSLENPPHNLSSTTPGNF